MALQQAEVPSQQAISFEAALRAASAESAGVRLKPDTTRAQTSLFTLDGSSVSALVSSAGVRHENAIVSAPALDYPAVDSEARTVTITWHRGIVGDPSYWRLSYTLPGGGGGEVVIPRTTTSITERLPAEGSYTARVRACDADGCSDWSETRSFELRPTGVPGRPAFCSATANGLVVTLTWGPAAPNTGGAPTTYVVLYNGNFITVGLITTISGTVPPGRYLLGVLARNAAGDSAAATCEVTVEDNTTQGKYKGSFTRTGTITRNFSDGSCTWQITFSGAVTVTLTQGTSGLTGTIQVDGTWSVPAGTPSGNIDCLSGSGSYNSTNPVIISGTNIARTAIDMDLATGTFSGNLSGTTISGTLSAKYDFGSGTVAIPVTLNRQ